MVAIVASLAYGLVYDLVAAHFRGLATCTTAIPVHCVAVIASLAGIA
jgi:hypothetical protein